MTSKEQLKMFYKISDAPFFGKLLQKTRINQNIELHILAKNSGLATKAILDFENGVRKPSILVLDNILEVLFD